MNKIKRKLTLICSLHYVKLAYRSMLFLLAAIMYVVENSNGIPPVYEEHWVLGLTWLVYVAEMTSRFFPSKFESMGCEKQFKRNYSPTGESKPQLQSWKSTLAVVIAWVLLNGAIGLLYRLRVIDKGIMILVSLAYGVCDMICILFFCPFQIWFMKNRCCTVCRIYNWDFAMMFTPFVFISSWYTWSLLGLSIVLLLRWELTLRTKPERFAENTNSCLECKNCKEKLCHHKTQLRRFWKRNKMKFKK